ASGQGWSFGPSTVAARLRYVGRLFQGRRRGEAKSLALDQRDRPRFRLTEDMTDLIAGFRYAARQFWHSRVFTTAAILTLALGIGGTTAIFTLIHAVMLRSLP